MTLFASSVSISAQSKLLLNASHVKCTGGFVMEAGVIAGGGSVIGGTGDVIASFVTVKLDAEVAPGWFVINSENVGTAPCERCWPSPPGFSQSMFGDLVFDTPVANLEQGSRLWVKDLVMFAEMSGRVVPGAAFDKIIFTGHLNANGTALNIIRSNNTNALTPSTPPLIGGPFLWPDNAGLVQWASISLLQNFTVNSVRKGLPFARCAGAPFSSIFLGPPVFVCKASNPASCTNDDPFNRCFPPDSNCGTISSTGTALSVSLYSSTPCGQVVPLNVFGVDTSSSGGGDGSNNDTSTTGPSLQPRASDNMIVVYIVVPVVVVIGVLIAVLIALYRRRQILRSKRAHRAR
jgi:hypothetical protein